MIDHVVGFGDRPTSPGVGLGGVTCSGFGSAASAVRPFNMYIYIYIYIYVYIPQTSLALTGSYLVSILIRSVDQVFPLSNRAI